MICLITLCYNEEKILPFFLNHYLRYVNKVIVFDNESTDNSRKIIQSYPNTKIIDNKTNGEISDLRYLEIKNNAWKTYRDYDWVIVVDMDEFLYHPKFLTELDTMKLNNVSLVPSIGFNMLGDSFPSDYNHQIFDKIKWGVEAPNYGKTCIFNPKMIEEINYTPGAHLCKPQGDIVVGYPVFKLLHYKYFGYAEWKYRNDLYASRLGLDRDGYADAYLMWQKEVPDEGTFLKNFGYLKRRKVL